MQVQEDSVEDYLFHSHKLMKQFDLEGGGTCTAPRSEPMEGIVVGDGGSEAAIENHCHQLPQKIHTTYAALVNTPFWD